jgi:hypothetical protein
MSIVSAAMAVYWLRIAVIAGLLCLSHAKHRIPRTNAHRCPAIVPDRGMLMSQSGEDEHLLLFFNGWCNGTYVELGALDGVTYSNTYVFNRMLDWRGILLDLSPDNFVKLQFNRKNEIAVIHAAVCAEETTVHYVAAGAVGGIWEFADPWFRKHWWADVSLDDAVPVKCIPLRSVFDDVFYADFFSLDVEGAELEVLQSIDFRNAAFGVVLVEADSLNPAKNAAVRELMVKKGYAFIYHHQRSDWFINEHWRHIYR